MGRAMKLNNIAIVPVIIGSATAFVSSIGRISRQQTKANGFLDDWKLVFSEEGRKNIKAYNEQAKREQEEAQEQIMARRNNPDLMEEYFEDVDDRRQKRMEEKEVWDFQKNESGEDPKNEWDKLREEGKIEVGSDLPRDPSTSRLGSEGLQEVRIDERMPYIEQGYVDEDADIMKGFMNLFGGGKKKE